MVAAADSVGQEELVALPWAAGAILFFVTGEKNNAQTKFRKLMDGYAWMVIANWTN